MFSFSFMKLIQVMKTEIIRNESNQFQNTLRKEYKAVFYFIPKRNSHDIFMQIFTYRQILIPLQM